MNLAESDIKSKDSNNVGGAISYWNVQYANRPGYNGTIAPCSFQMHLILNLISCFGPAVLEYVQRLGEQIIYKVGLTLLHFWKYHEIISILQWLIMNWQE